MFGLGCQPSDFAVLKVVADGTADLVVDKSTLDCSLAHLALHQASLYGQAAGFIGFIMGQWRLRDRLQTQLGLQLVLKFGAQCR